MILQTVHDSHASQTLFHLTNHFCIATHLNLQHHDLHDWIIKKQNSKDLMRDINALNLAHYENFIST